MENDTSIHRRRSVRRRSFSPLRHSPSLQNGKSHRTRSNPNESTVQSNCLSLRIRSRSSDQERHVDTHSWLWRFQIDKHLVVTRPVCIAHGSINENYGRKRSVFVSHSTVNDTVTDSVLIDLGSNAVARQVRRR